ncbi:MAG: MlaD family protein [Verrucomicrobiae bacterium]
MQIHRNEITTGILVLATSAFLLAILVMVGMPGVIRPLNTYRIYYDNANGVRPGAPVFLGGREIGKVTSLDSPIPLEKRPAGHPDYEVSIDVQVAKEAAVYHKVTVHLAQQGLMGQQAIDFVQGDASSGLAENHFEFVGERVPDIAESMNDQMQRLTGPGSDLSLAVKNAKTFMETLNNSKIQKVISNAEELTDTLKKEPWRLLWPSKPLTEVKKPAVDTRKESARAKQDRLHRAADQNSHAR